MTIAGKFGRITAGAAVLLLPVAGVAVAAPAASAAQAAPHAVTTLYYDTSDAPDLVAQVNQAAQNWDGVVHNVQLVAGDSSDATIVVHETDDGQGSYTQTDGHGNGDIYIDEQQIAQGFDPTRIAAHEFGHNLGLPDDYTGPCSEIMSGHGPGTSCTNAMPDATEAATVDSDWAEGFAAHALPRTTVAGF
jgi:snapalysin